MNAGDIISIAHRFARGSLWSSFGAFAAQGVSLLTAVFAARLLGVEAFGAYGILTTTVATVVVFGNLGLGLTATKHLAEHRHDADRAARLSSFLLNVSLLASVVVSALTAVSAPWMAIHVLRAEHLTSELYLCGFVIFFSVHQATQQGLLYGREDFRAAARINVIRAVAVLVAVVGGTVKFGLAGAIAGLVVANLLTCILFHMALAEKGNRPANRANGGVCRDASVLWRFSLPSVLGAAVVALGLWWASAILVRQPSGLAEMGIFNAACQLRNVVVCLPQILCATALPILCGERTRGTVGFGTAIDMLQRVVSLVTVPVVTVLVLVGEPVLRIFGHGFRDNITTVLVLLGSGLAAISTPSGTALAATGRMWLGFGLNAVWGTVLVGGGAWLAPKYGAAALAAAFAGTYILHVALGLWYTRSVVPRVTLTVSGVASVCMVGIAASTLLLPTVAGAMLSFGLAALAIGYAMRAGDATAGLWGVLQRLSVARFASGTDVRPSSP